MKTGSLWSERQPAAHPLHEIPYRACFNPALVITSPPFLDVVDYRCDNWLRC